MRYWQRRPYLGCGLDASSMALTREQDQRYALRWTTTDSLSDYLEGNSKPETAWLSPDRQLEEAWFLGLRLNSGVDPAGLEAEFGSERVRRALVVAERLVRDGLLEQCGKRFRLSSRGRMVSNDVFQEFLEECTIAREQ
jgi:oxygen-independent coproporphyrinogen-3 oxidase